MPFPWLKPDVPRRYAATFPRKAEAMYLRELEERAALLFRLRYPRDLCKLRLRGNVRWDFEMHKTPAFIARVDAIVDAVYGRGGRARGGPPSLE